MDPLTRLALDAGHGDQVAVTAFIRATQADVIRFLSFLTEPQHAEDLAQETYLRALRGLSTYRGAAPAKTWLLAVARHVVTDWLRSRMRRPSIASSNVQLGADARDFTAEVELRTLVASLPLDRREAFTLTQVLGMSYEEAAAILECPIGTVRSRVYRARADLVTSLLADDSAAVND